MWLESRDALNLVDPDRVSHDVHPERGGLAIHWGGERVDLVNHAQCQTLWKAWQTHHMQTRGWADIAYNFGVCDHGYILTGRGWGVRSAANGTDDANERYLAACWLGGPGDGAPTARALAAFEHLIRLHLAAGGRADIAPHSRFVPTACPGPVLTAHCEPWSTLTPGASAVPTFPLPAGWYFGPKEGSRESVSGYYSHRADLARWQRRAGVLADGLYGPITRSAAIALQRRRGLVVDGLIGIKTWRAAWE